MLDSHIKSAIFNFSIVTTNSYSAYEKTAEIFQILKKNTP